MLGLDWSFNSFRAAGTNGRLDCSLSWGLSSDPASQQSKIWSGTTFSPLTRRVSPPSGKAQLARCLKELADSLLQWDVGTQ